MLAVNFYFGGLSLSAFQYQDVSDWDVGKRLCIPDGVEDLIE